MALLFFACALVPISLFSALTLWRVRDQLAEQSRARLSVLAKENAQSLVARLHFAALELVRLDETELADVRWAARTWTTAGALDDAAAESRAGFDIGVALEGEARERLADGEPFLGISEGRVVLAQPGETPASPIRWAVLEPDYLRGWLLPWEDGTVRSPLPADIELCVFAASEPLVACPEDLVAVMAAGTTAAGDPVGGRASFEWGPDGARRLASTRAAFLRPSFGADDWTIVVSEPRHLAFASASGFERTFLLAALLSLLVIPFLSQVQIRRNLVPLEKLKEGTRRIAGRDFRSRVDIRSGDEFEELGGSFNAMAERLGRQFDALKTASEIDRAILGALDSRAILETVLRRGPEVLPESTIALISRDPAGRWARYRLEEGRLASRRFPAGAERGGVEGESPLPSEGEWSSPSDGEAPDGDAPPTTFPVRLDGADHGALVVSSPRPLSADDREHAEQLADRFAVALSNARLIGELDRMNLETIAAFARAIDAKSHWTAGHSERVTAMALELGRILGLEDEDLEILHRGGLLHDVGKIGIPGDILDKPGPLDEDEMSLMRAHPVIGAEIIAPITRFRPMVPIVRHHHERYDGKGYPDGLSGPDIDFLAQVVAVADVFDALQSERPYRAAMPIDRVRSIIVGDAGTAFHPRIVDAFERVLDERDAGHDAAALRAGPVARTAV